MECAAFPFFALHPDIPAHERHKIRANREPQAGTTVTPGEGPIRLHKRVEDARLLRRRDSDPGIGDAKMKYHLGLIERFQPHRQRYAALIGELNRVPSKIQEDLTEAARIAYNCRWRIGSDM